MIFVGASGSSRSACKFLIRVACRCAVNTRAPRNASSAHRQHQCPDWPRSRGRPPSRSADGRTIDLAERAAEIPGRIEAETAVRNISGSAIRPRAQTIQISHRCLRVQPTDPKTTAQHRCVDLIGTTAIRSADRHPAQTPIRGRAADMTYSG